LMRIAGTNRMVRAETTPGDWYPLAGGQIPPMVYIQIDGDEAGHHFADWESAERWLYKQEQERGIRFFWEDW